MHARSSERVVRKSKTLKLSGEGLEGCLGRAAFHLDDKRSNRVTAEVGTTLADLPTNRELSVKRRVSFQPSRGRVMQTLLHTGQA